MGVSRDFGELSCSRLPSLLPFHQLGDTTITENPCIWVFIVFLNL